MKRWHPCFLKGAPIAKAVKELETHLDDDRQYAAKRLILTETTYAYTKAREEAFKDTGVKKYKYSALLDGRTSSICSSLHGKIFNLEDAQVGRNMPPMHPYCRSCIIAQYDEPLLSEKTYRMKTPDGKYIRIPAGLEKDEWRKRWGDGSETAKKRANSDKIGYNMNRAFNSGANAGALHPDEDFHRAEEHAKKYYGWVRKVKHDVDLIAKHSGFLREDILKIKQYIFVDFHDFLFSEKNPDGRFYPDFAMADSWRRLIEGDNIQPHDITLLHHELMELQLVKEEGLDQSEAHERTSEKYNFWKELNSYYDHINKHKKRKGLRGT